jgi:flagellar protein FlbD
MIKVTRFNREVVYVNPDLIEYLETTPDTVISLTTGEKFMVLETPDQIVDLVVAFERRIHGHTCGYRRDHGESDISRFAGALRPGTNDPQGIAEQNAREDYANRMG